MHVLRVLDAIALQRTEIVSIPQLCEQILENGPVPITTSGSVLVLEMGFDIGLDVIVVEKRIVDIDQEDDLIHRSYPYATSRTRLSVRLSRTQMLQHADASALCPSDCRRQISGTPKPMATDLDVPRSKAGLPTPARSCPFPSMLRPVRQGAEKMPA